MLRAAVQLVAGRHEARQHDFGHDRIAHRHRLFGVADAFVGV